MLIKPALKDDAIIQCLRESYKLDIENISFLPLGADLNTAVYRIITNTRIDYFLKLRRGEFNKASVLIPKCLADLGIKQVISPITTQTRQLWTNLASFKAILYPYVKGKNGIDAKLSDQQWIEFGETMKKIHHADISQAMIKTMPKENFSPKWCQTVNAFLKHIEEEVFEEPAAAKMALFLKSKSTEIFELVRRTEHLAHLLQKQSLEYTLCHADIHGWNLLIDEAGALYVVDWDTLLFAPKERDLMFIGAGIWDSGRTPLEEENLFYQGYGSTNINQDAIAYYRCERIIEDIGVYCEQIFLSNEGREDRIQSFQYLQSIFLPNGALERADHAYDIRES